MIVVLVLSREIGQAVLIEDVVVTLVAATAEYAEVSLQKLSGGKTVIATLPKQQCVDACYDTQLVYIEGKGKKVRLGIEAAADLFIQRKEVWDVQP